ncbi:cbb3-type cytochrome oxidase subunit 3 [Kangiella sp. M94]
MDINIFRGVMTLIIMLLFIGLCIWVYSKKRKPMYEDAARMALDEDDRDSGSASNRKEAVTHE